MTTRRPAVPPRSPRWAVAVTTVVVALICTACLFDQPRPVDGGTLDDDVELEVEPRLVGVAYGPDPAQVLDVYPGRAESPGTILYFHSGGWVGGDESKVAAIVGSALDSGWAIVSVGYRLAPAHRAADLVADADRALRHVRAHAAELGVDASTVVVAGGSAGGHLAAMLATAPGVFADPGLPAELATVDPTPDALMALVAPTDLATLSQAGGWAPAAQASLLGCSASGSPVATDVEVVPPCGTGVVDRFSPLAWAREAGRVGRPLPPAYFAYGGLDGLVDPTTQGAPIAAVWADVAGYGRAWYDLAAGSGHNVDHDVRVASLERWLERVAGDDW